MPWDRDNAPTNPIILPDGRITIPKGLTYVTPHVNVLIRNFDPCDLVWLYSPPVRHWHDSHGATDHLRANTLQVEDLDLYHVVPQVAVRWVSDIRCAGTKMRVTYHSWLLIAGSTANYGDQCGSFVEAQGDLDWMRNFANWHASADWPNAPDKKGYWENILMLPICKRWEPCTQVMKPGDPICEAKLLPDGTYTDPRAMAAKVYYDTHGGLDKVEGYYYFGPRDLVVRDVTSRRIPCEPPVEGPGDWELTITQQEVWLHPGSIFLGADEELFDCGNCCGCVCVLTCADKVFVELCPCFDFGLCRTIHATMHVHYLNELYPGFCAAPKEDSDTALTMNWVDVDKEWFATTNIPCIGDIGLHVRCIGTGVFELFIDMLATTFTCAFTTLVCCPFYLSFIDCNLGFQFACCGTVTITLILTE